LVLLNDWSARDIQSFEYQPLGPFLSKSLLLHFILGCTAGSIARFYDAVAKTNSESVEYLQQASPNA